MSQLAAAETISPIGAGDTTRYGRFPTVILALGHATSQPPHFPSPNCQYQSLGFRRRFTHISTDAIGSLCMSYRCARDDRFLPAARSTREESLPDQIGFLPERSLNVDRHRTVRGPYFFYVSGHSQSPRIVASSTHVLHPSAERSKPLRSQTPHHLHMICIMQPSTYVPRHQNLLYVSSRSTAGRPNPSTKRMIRRLKKVHGCLLPTRRLDQRPVYFVHVVSV